MRRLLVLATTATCLIVLGLTVPAYAISGPGLVIKSGPTVSGTTVPKGENAVSVPGSSTWGTQATLAAAGTAPSCLAKSNYPHVSNTQPGYVHAQGTLSNCTWKPYYLYISGELTRDRWYGEQELNSGHTGPKYNVWTLSDTRVWKCAGVGTYTYHLYNYHEVGGSDGSYTYAYTSNSNRFNC